MASDKIITIHLLISKCLVKVDSILAFSVIPHWGPPKVNISSRIKRNDESRETV